MVLFFTSAGMTTVPYSRSYTPSSIFAFFTTVVDPPVTLYMGKDKYESKSVHDSISDIRTLC